MSAGSPDTNIRPPPKRVTRTGIASTTTPLNNKYEYSPIADDEIRLLILQPGGAGDMIECALLTSSTQEIDYEVLSYVWGTDAPMCEIRIQCQDFHSMRNFKRAKHFIGQDLYTALSHLRDREREIVLWVDALCINQNNLRERAVHASKLATIYNRATNVCFWLGEGSLSSATAFRFIPEILDLSHFGRLVHDETASEKWLALAELMKRPLFSRLWAIQYIAAARDVSLHCGNEMIHWADFADAVALFGLKFEEIKCVMRSSLDIEALELRDVRNLHASILVETTHNLLRKADDGSFIDRTATLETLVTTLSIFEAADARDYIYALLPIAKQGPSSPDIVPSDVSLPDIDYHKNVVEVYQDFVKFCIRSSYSLDIICRHWVPVAKYKTFEGAPSWIRPLTGSPFGANDTGLTGRINGDSFVGLPGRPIYRASGLTRPVATFGTGSTYDGSLSVKGFRLDRISCLGPRNADGLILSENLRMGGWVRDAEGYSEPTVPDRLWRTLVADRGQNGTNPPSWYHRACLYCLVHARSTGDVNTNDLISSGGLPMVVQFLKRVQCVIWNRKFFITERKCLLGLAPRHAQQGDIICILFGCSVPVVLRELSSTHPETPIDVSRSSRPLFPPERRFELIGECYVHGVMEGEAFREGLADVERRSEIFKLY
jgi:hypothetical protein